MTDKMISEMKKKINANIEVYYRFVIEGESRQRDRNNVFYKISGMIEMLEMVTGEIYDWDESGLKEIC